MTGILHDIPGIYHNNNCIKWGLDKM